QDAAGRADFDDVGAVLDLKSHGIAKLIRTARNAVGDRRLGSEALVGKPVAVAVTAASTQRMHRDEHPWTGGSAGGDRVAKPDVDVVAGSDVAHGRESGHQRPPRELRSAQRRFGNRPSKS